MRIGPVGLPELLILLVIVLVLFGVGRIGKIAGELGSGIRAFKDGLKGPEESKTDEKDSSKESDKSE